MSYAIPIEKDNDKDGTGYGQWGRVFLLSKSAQSYDMETTKNSFLIVTKSEVTDFWLSHSMRVMSVMTFIILHMEPTLVGFDISLILSTAIEASYEWVKERKKIKSLELVRCNGILKAHSISVVHGPLSTSAWCV